MSAHSLRGSVRCGPSPGARSLVVVLRYLHVAGLIELPLEWAVPGVADLRDRSLPRGLEPVVVKKLLASCDRRRTVGRRDYAILLLLARLGLRAGEIAAITLEDVDWRRGELLIHGKGGRDDLLPLPLRSWRGAGLVLAPPGTQRIPDAVLEGARARWADVRRCDQRGYPRCMRARGDPAGRTAPAQAHRGDRDARSGSVACGDRTGRLGGSRRACPTKAT